MQLNPQAQNLNNIITKDCQAIFNLLSNKGRAIFFPKEGILAQAAEARGKKINATIGIAIEDDLTPMRLRCIEENISIDPIDAFPYAPSFGKPELRKKWQEMIFKKNPSLKGKLSLPVVTNALTHGLSIVGYLFVDENDKIILPDKFWGNYKLTFVNAYGAVIDTFNTFADNGFDLDSLRSKLNEEGTKKILLLNFPNNPTGYSLTEEEADKIALIIKQAAESGKEILVICDDAYFGLVFKDGIFKESIFSKISDIHENVLAVKLDGATKEDYVWGFRVGFISYASKNITDEACSALEAKTAGAIRGNISNAPHVSQSLVLKGFSSGNYEKEKKEKYATLYERFKEVEDVLSDKKYDEYFEPLPFNSGYFMCIKLKKSLNAEEVRKLLLRKYDTGTISVGSLLRIAFSAIAKKDIRELFDNIYKACEDLS